MTGYVIQRLLLNIPGVLLVVTLVFLATHVMPDYAVRTIAGTMGAEDYEQAKEQVRRELGLDKPLWKQYTSYLGGLARGDLGHSFMTKRPVLLELKDRMGPSIELGLLQLVVAMLLAIPIGVISAIRQDTWIDYILRFFAILWLAIPSFYLAVILLIIVFKGFGWAPPLTNVAWRDFFDNPAENLKMLALPAVAGGMGLGAGMMRLLRSQMLEVLRQDFVRTAWAKGLREQTVVTRHVLKNAMIPVFTFAGLMVGNLFSGEIILEWMFSIPGMGIFAVQSIRNNDFLVAQGLVLVVAVALVFTNLVVDLTYGWLDPRVRYR